MFDYRNTGQSVMELSHRQDAFRHLNIMCKREIKKFLQVPDNFTIMLQQGGATMQYTAIVKNLIGLKPFKKAMHLKTGMWSNQCFAELKKYSEVITVADTITANDCTAMVPHDQWKIDPEASFFSYCSNETVNGFEIPWETFPWHLIPKDCPVCVDMSSNIGTNHIPWDKVGVIYAGAQKNLGTAGCTVIIVRNDLMGKAAADTPILCDWETFENSPDKCYNTPCVWAIYVTGLNVSYMNQQGGLEHYIQLAKQRSSMIWSFIDSSNGFYKTKITDSHYRSHVNICFRIQNGDKEIEAQFIKEAKNCGIVQITGHYFNPGIRISMYNSQPMGGVVYLISFMRQFMQQHTKHSSLKYAQARL